MSRLTPDLESSYYEDLERFVELCEKYLTRWLSVRENDSGIQLLGQFAMPMIDAEVAI